MDDRRAAWSAVFRFLPIGWKVNPVVYRADERLWVVTAVDVREHVPEASRGRPIEAHGGTEAEAAERLAELLEERSVP